MTVHKGKNGIVKIGASPSIVAEVREWSLDVSGDVTDSTSMNTAQSNGGWKTFADTLKEWGGSVSCWWDPSDTNGQEALDAGTSLAVEFYPDDDDTGDIKYSGTAIVTAINRSGKLDGNVEASFTFKGTGALSQAAVGA